MPRVSMRCVHPGSCIHAANSPRVHSVAETRSSVIRTAMNFMTSERVAFAANCCVSFTQCCFCRREALRARVGCASMARKILTVTQTCQPGADIFHAGLKRPLDKRIHADTFTCEAFCLYRQRGCAFHHLPRRSPGRPTGMTWLRFWPRLFRANWRRKRQLWMSEDYRMVIFAAVALAVVANAKQGKWKLSS